ncbi:MULTISPECIES: hypothetical protein [Methylobacterium]|uniref:hypothetical protein n=1 Tax=Methylobacterium TaxID=407 RepID=UPI00138F729B|nr:MULTISPECIES: hypothetical protein [Methylobacterium]MCI9880308.1 hypothetical protein [Methylobacterium goesingense]
MNDERGRKTTDPHQISQLKGMTFGAAERQCGQKENDPSRLTSICGASIRGRCPDIRMLVKHDAPLETRDLHYWRWMMSTALFQIVRDDLFLTR